MTYDLYQEKEVLYTDQISYHYNAYYVERFVRCNQTIAKLFRLESLWTRGVNVPVPTHGNAFGVLYLGTGI